MTCKFYEEDIQARLEAEEMDRAYIEMIGEDRYAEEQRVIEEMIGECDLAPADDDDEVSCGFCKYLINGSGFPGEHIVACKCPECAHIIATEFHGGEVI